MTFVGAGASWIALTFAGDGCKPRYSTEVVHLDYFIADDKHEKTCSNFANDPFRYYLKLRYHQ